MTFLSQRQIALEIDLPGGRKRIQGLSMSYTVTKTSGIPMNKAEIKVINLGREDREYLLTGTSHRLRPSAPRTATIFAGYNTTGMAYRFTGDITSATQEKNDKSGQNAGRDITLKLTVETGQRDRGKLIARSEGPQIRLSQLAGLVAADLGLDLEFQAEDKSVANYSYTGPAIGQVAKLSAIDVIDAYIDDTRLIVKDRGKPLAGRLNKITLDTGMIEVPTVTENGVAVKILLNPAVTIGSEIDLESGTLPAADGRYTVYEFTEEASTHGNDFYMKIKANRAGLGGNPR